MVRQLAAGIRICFEQKRNAVRAALLGPLRADQNAESLIVDLMPAAPRIITLNLGSQTIGLAEFRAQPHGGLVLQGCRLRELVVEAADDGVARSQIFSDFAK